jgi:hypothetical protein
MDVTEDLISEPTNGLDVEIEIVGIPYNKDDDASPQHQGSYVPLFIGSEYCGDEPEEFISTLCVAKVQHLSKRELKIKQNGSPLGDKTEPYVVLSTERIRAFQFLSNYHPADLTGNAEAIKAWRAGLQLFIDIERGLFEKRRQKIRADQIRKHKIRVKEIQRFQNEQCLPDEAVASELNPILSELHRLEATPAQCD